LQELLSMIVFGIGQSKTGSTSLAEAMPMLGYKTKDQVFDLAEVDAPASALTDPNQRYYYKITPIARAYSDVDKRFPGAKFILTVRDVDGWLKSAARQFRNDVEPDSPGAKRRLENFGATVFDEAKFRESFHRHIAEVKEYFKGRPKDLLVIDICGGQGWGELCKFLGEKTPALPFPKENVSGSKEKFFRKLKAMIFGGSAK